MTEFEPGDVIVHHRVENSFRLDEDSKFPWIFPDGSRTSDEGCHSFLTNSHARGEGARVFRYGEDITDQFIS